MRAVKNKNQLLQMVNLLLSRGANVHQKCHCGRTALHEAACYWHRDIFPAIFSAAGPRAMNFPTLYGWTPFHFLAVYGSSKHMAFALSHPGIDTRNYRGRIPLDVAAYYRPALQTYGDQEARWQPLRYTWIKSLMIPTRR
jgi:ankyrin repeat protein